MEYKRPEYIVYVRMNDFGYITAVNSSAFLSDTTGWTEIDRGYGNKYGHAQGNYFPQPIFTMGGAYRYKLVDGKPQECTSEEIQQQEDANQPELPPDPGDYEARIQALEEELAAAKIILGVE